MEFVKEFSTELFKNQIIRFGDFTLASGKKSSYYIDLRLVPSYPVLFRKMIKQLQKEIEDKVGLDKFDAICSVPTGGLAIASALAIETVKPSFYVRNKPKDYGTTKMIEGKYWQDMRCVIIDDVATTGGSVITGIRELKKEKIIIDDVFVIVNRLEGAKENLLKENVHLHHVIDIRQITKSLYEDKIIDSQTFGKIEKQLG